MACANQWTEMPLHIVLYEWLEKNMNVPSDMGTLFAYVAFIMLIVYSMTWFVKMVLGVLWPLFITATAIIAFQLLQTNRSTELHNLLTETYRTMSTTLNGLIDGFMDLLNKLSNQL